MFVHKPFYDLSVCETNLTRLKPICDTMIDLGYSTIAVNQIIGEPEFPSKKKKKKKGECVDIPDPVPEPVPLGELQKEYFGKLKIYNRLTFSFSDQLQGHNMLQSSKTKKYDILAAIPTTQNAYQLLCGSMNVDIISFDAENQYSVKHNRKMYNLAIRRGMCFEVAYGPALVDDTMRRNVITRGQIYHYFGKSKNIIVTSNASSPLHLKGPYDVINIALLFGLSEEQAKYSITEAAKKVLHRAVCRRLGKIAPILVEYSGVQAGKVGGQIAVNMEQEETESCTKRLRQS